jgi:hypothetical protein
MTSQHEFDFDGAGQAPDGHAQWLAGRQATLSQLAHRLNLPLGHRVEVWLRGSTRLRGVLRLKDDPLLVEAAEVKNLQLMVDRVAFGFGELDSCVRMD